MDITKIVKKKVFAIFNSSLELLTNEQSYNFVAMQQRDMAYDRIYALWKVQSPYAKYQTTEENHGSATLNRSVESAGSSRGSKKGFNRESMVTAKQALSAIRASEAGLETE